MPGRVSAKPLLSSFGSFLLLSLLMILGCGGGKQIVNSQPVTLIPVSVSLTVNPTAVLPGQNATLTWSTSGASSCNAVGAWSGSQKVNGSINVALPTPTTQTYALECFSSTGQGARSTATLSLSPANGACAANHALSTAKGRRTVNRHTPNGNHS
jgi:hypothetical protein